eukprot:4383026-Pyramimonas_sp.AAC.1
MAASCPDPGKTHEWQPSAARDLPHAQLGRDAGPTGRGGARLGGVGADEFRPTVTGAHRHPLRTVRHSPRPGAASPS